MQWCPTTHRNHMTLWEVRQYIGSVWWRWEGAKDSEPGYLAMDADLYDWLAADSVPEVPA